MATYFKLSEDNKQMFECCICAEVFSEPRALPCLHTFCLRCLQDQGSHMGKNPGDAIACPVCRAEYLIPKDGFAALPKNFMMDTLVQGLRLSETVDKKSTCDRCRRVNKLDGTMQIQSAENYCLECQQYLCNQCTEDHASDNLSKNHKMTTSLECKPKQQLELSVDECKVGQCHEHPEKQLDMYCHSCSLFVCRSCIGESHDSHNCGVVENVVEEIKQVIDNEFGKLSEYITEVSTRKEQLQKRKEIFLKEIEAKETAIINGMPTDDQKHHFLVELASTKQHGLKALDIENEEVDRHHASLESFKAFLTTFKGRRTSGEALIMKFKDVLKQASDIRRLHESLALHQVSSGTIEDENADGSKNTKARDTTNTSTAVVLHTSVRLTAQLKVPMCVAGVTRLPNEIYVLRHGSQSSSIHVYKDESPFQLQTEILLEDVRFPHDIVSSNESRCLYISDKDNKCVWNMTVPDYRLREWLKPVGDPFTMSLTSEDLVVLPRSGQPTRLEVYDPNATLIHRVKLGSEIKSIRHAVEATTMGNFIILVQWTAGRTMSVEQQQTSGWTLCEVNRDGHTVRTFEADVAESQQLNNPHHLSLDMNYGGVFVVDYGSHTVVQFDSDLKWKQILLSTYKNSLVKPLRLFFDQTKRQLLVGQRGGTVSMYTV